MGQITHVKDVFQQLTTNRSIPKTMQKHCIPLLKVWIMMMGITLRSCKRGYVDKVKGTRCLIKAVGNHNYVEVMSHDLYTLSQVRVFQ